MTIFLPILVHLFSLFPFAENEQASAVLLRVNGDVQTRPSEQSSWTKGNRGIKLNPDSYLKTGNKSYAVIVFQDGSVIRLSNNTEVKLLGEISSDGDYSKREVKLNLGSIGFDVIANSSKPFRFVSVTATASIKGTEGVFSVSETESDLSLLSSESDLKEVGEIKSTNSEQIEPIRIGEKARASIEAITEKRKLREDELKDLRNRIVQRRTILKRELEAVRFKIRENAEKVRENREELRKRMEEERRQRSK